MDVVQGLWVSGPLSRIERLSIESFVRHGHEYHLYTYENSEYALPAGAIQKDAAEIIPRDAVWRHGFGAEAGSLGGFSDYFRFNLLYERGGIWADADLVCLRPLRLDRPLFISAETARPGIEQPSTQLLKFAKGDPLLRRAIEFCESQDPAKVEFLQVGPHLIHRLVDEMGYRAHVLRAKVANPVPWWQYYVMFLGERAAHLAEIEADPDICCVHLWNEMIRRLEISKDAAVEPQAPIEQLIARYGLSPGRDAPAERRRIRSRMLFAEATVEFEPAPVPDFEAEVWREIIHLDPAYADVYQLLATLAATAGEVAELERLIGAAPDEIGTHPLVLVELSKASARINRPEASHALLDQAGSHAMTAHPTLIGSVFLERFRRRDLAKIAQLFDALPEALKSDPGVLFAVARMHVAQGRHEDALAVTQRLIELDPRYQNCHTLAAETLLKLGRLDAAEHHARLATETWARPWPWKVLGRVCLAKGQEDAARDAFRRCQELGGGDQPARNASPATASVPIAATF